MMDCDISSTCQQYEFLYQCSHCFQITIQTNLLLLNTTYDEDWKYRQLKGTERHFSWESI